MIAKTPPWLDEAPVKSHFEPLTSAHETDVLIIGAGITGLATAYILNKAGLTVTVIEKDTLGAGATGHTTAFISQMIDTDLNALVEMLGEENAANVWRSGQDALDLIDQIVTYENIDCEFNRCDYTVYALDPKDIDDMREEVKTIRHLGFKGELHPHGELTFLKNGYLKIPNQAKFSPLKYIDQLAAALNKKNVQIFEHTEATEIKEKENGEVHVQTNKHPITAKHVVVATYTPFTHKMEHFFKAAYYEDFMMEVTVPSDSLPEGLYTDTATPYNYFRVDKKKTHDRLILGGLTHRVQIPLNADKAYAALEKVLEAVVPGVQYEITRQWQGWLIETLDGLPYIGTLMGHKRVFVATGFSGNGMTYAHVAAKLFRDLIQNKPNPLKELYDAQRVPNVKSLIQKGRDYGETLLGGLKKI